MPKPSKGGKRTRGATITRATLQAKAAPHKQTKQEVQNLQTMATQNFNPQSVMPATPQDVARGNVMPSGGTPFAQFQKMSDDEKAQVIADALLVKPPMFLDDSALQRVAYFTGMSDKPKVVTAAELDRISGKSLYRTVNDGYDRAKDISYTAKEIYDQIARGDYTMYSGGNRSAYGKGIYFADSVTESSWYASQGSPNGKSQMMKAKFDPTKPVASRAQIDSIMRSERRKNSKLWQVVSQADSKSQYQIMALAKGYYAIDEGRGRYKTIINRSCLILADHTMATYTGDGRKWQ